MARIRISTRSHTKEKPYVEFASFAKIEKAKMATRVNRKYVGMGVRYVLKYLHVCVCVGGGWVGRCVCGGVPIVIYLCGPLFV